MKRPVQQLVARLLDQSLTIAFAESVTCGLAAHMIGSVPNTSEVFMGSIVCYDAAVKKSILKIPDAILKKHSAESAEVTKRLARNLSNHIKADIYLAVTGLAAPGGSESKAKPVGTVFHAMQFRGKIYQQRVRYTGTPLQIKKKAVDGMFAFVIKHIV